MDGGSSWSQLSGKRRGLVVALIALGLTTGAYIALHPDDQFRASAMSIVAALSSGLGALVSALRALIAFRERESLWMKGGMLLLTLILAGLFYDAVT